MENEQQPPCPACGGSGQINFFKGESRFLLSVEECPACCGLGSLPEPPKEERTEFMEQEQESGQKNGKQGIAN
jgi:DnaJ-class molecular chaperone